MVRWCCSNFQCRGILLIPILVEQGPTVLTVGAGRDCLDIFSLLAPLLSKLVGPPHPWHLKFTKHHRTT